MSKADNKVKIFPQEFELNDILIGFISKEDCTKNMAIRMLPEEFKERFGVDLRKFYD